MTNCLSQKLQGGEMRVWFGSLKKVTVYLTLLAAFTCIAFAMVNLFGVRGKWLSSAGLFLDIAGLIQLSIGEVFQELLKYYADEERFPYGPPSMSTFNREIMDSAGPLQGLYAGLFWKPQTGLYLIVLGCLLQLAGTWM